VCEPAVLLCTLDKDKLSALFLMGQIVGHWLLLWRLWFSPRPVHMVFVVGIVALGQFPLNTWIFPCHYLPTLVPDSFIHSFIHH